MKAPPAESRAQLEAIIADLSTGFVALEPDGGLRYANRAALSAHRVDALAALGGSAAGYAARFRLEDLTGVPLPESAYPFARLLAGETFSDLNVRVPAGGDVLVHRLRGLQLLDGAGEPDFYALLIEDETERFDAEERFERTFGANPAPALINRLSDLRFIKVNRGFLEMTGFRREEVVGRTAYEFDVFAGATGREGALRQFHGGEPIRPLESYLAVRGGGQKFVLVGGQPLEVGSEACMLLTFVDLDERKRAEDALAESEARFSKAFTLAPFAAAISDLKDGRIYNVNDAFKKLTGYSAAEATGRTSAELGLWRSEGERLVADLLRTSRGYRDLELKLYTKGDEVKDVLASAETLMLGEKPCALWMFHDVTVLKRNEAELVEAINLVMADPNWFSTTVARKLMAVKGRGPSAETLAKLGRLTGRERQVLDLVCRGLRSSAVADDLGVSGNTVRNYISSLYKKLGVHSRAELIVWAKRHDVTL